jgi:hypothetical protein
MKLSTLDIILGFIILVLLIVIAVLVFKKEKFVGGYNSASSFFGGPSASASGSGPGVLASYNSGSGPGVLASYNSGSGPGVLASYNSGSGTGVLATYKSLFGGPISGSGSGSGPGVLASYNDTPRLVVSATIDSNAFSDKTNMTTFINYVGKIAPHVSVVFKTVMNGDVPPSYSGSLQLNIPSPGSIISRGAFIGKNSFFWDDATNQFDRMILEKY